MTTAIISMSAKQFDDIIKLSRKENKTKDEMLAEILLLGVDYYATYQNHCACDIPGKNVYVKIDAPMLREEYFLTFLNRFYEVNTETLYRRVIKYGMDMYHILSR